MQGHPAWTELIARAVVALAMSAAAGVSAWILARALIGPGLLLLRLASALVAGAWILTALFHVLLELGHFEATAGLAALFLIAALLLTLRRHRLRREARTDVLALRRLSARLARSPQRWIAGLAERGVTEVMSFIPRSLELEWMAETPAHFERIAGGVKWGLYRFHPPPPPGS
jgi:hypothetical protein